MKFLILCALVGLSVAQLQVQFPQQNPNQLPPVQVQIPIQRPQQPQPPQAWPQPQPQPQPIWPQPPVIRPQPVPPTRPNFPRNSWRDGEFDARCPNPDDHEGLVVFLPGPTQNTFFKCWGTIAWPFTCPLNTVFSTVDNVCTDPANLGSRPIVRPNWPNFRPFEDDETVQDE